MARMVRKQVYLEREQDEFLKQQSAERGVSEAELIRDAVELLARGRGTPRHVVLDHRAWQEEVDSWKELLPIPGATRSDRGWTRSELYDD